MIDLGLTKLAVIGVIALVVIGPEKLPKVARMAGTLYGRAQRYLNDVKSEVTREIELEELRNLQKEVQDAAQAVKTDVENSIAQNKAEVENAFSDISSSSSLSDSSDSSSSYSHTAFGSVTTDDLARKAREFRRKKLVRNSAIPNWYKQRNGGKQHVTSGAARVARFRPRGPTNSSFY